MGAAHAIRMLHAGATAVLERLWGQYEMAYKQVGPLVM